MGHRIRCPELQLCPSWIRYGRYSSYIYRYPNIHGCYAELYGICSLGRTVLLVWGHVRDGTSFAYVMTLLTISKGSTT
jgi:hypothetical protein